MKVGFVAILGRPNVGKSTFLNAVLSKKVSIVSPKAQTTRDAIIGILTTKEEQIVFVDTPGIYFGDQKLDSHMRRQAFNNARDVDCILYLIDAAEPSLESDIKIIRSIKSEAPRILLLNKIDRISIEEGMKKIAELQEAFPEDKIIQTSFLKNFGIKEVKDAIEPYLTEGDMLYPDEMLTDKGLDYQCKEIIREKCLHFLRQEIPHQSAIRIDRLEVKHGVIYLEASIILEKESHKAIVIGKGGSMIKKISMAARQEMERNFHQKVALFTLKAEVIPGWRNSMKALADLGYGDK